MRRLLPSLTLLLLTLPPARAQDGPEPPEVTKMREAVPALQKKLEELRGAKFKSPVAVRYQTEDEFRAYMQVKLDEDYPPEKARKDALMLGAMGYLPAGFDLRKAIVDAMASQALAHYDPAEDAFFVLKTEMPESQVAGTVLHELHHALQDQLHDLGASMKAFSSPDFTDEDAVLAYRCLVEGEAFYLQMKFEVEQQGAAAMLGQMLQMMARTPRRQLEAMEQQQLMMMGEDGAAMREALEARAKLPGYLYNQLVSPYFKGGLAVNGYVQRGGWATIDELFRTFPKSTEQVLHPEKALPGEQHDAPTAVELPDLASALGDGWRFELKKTFGELQLRVLFETLEGKEQVGACAGWDGDLAQAYSKGDQAAFAWFLVFDTDQDATEFSTALGKARGKAAEPMKSADVTARGGHVLVLGGVPAEKLEAVREAAFTGKTLR